MALLTRIAMAARTRFVPSSMNKIFKAKPKENMVFGFITCNMISTHRVTKNIELITEDDNTIIDRETKRAIVKNENRPLLVLLPWLMSRKRHVKKFVQFYMEQGFDVVSVAITPWQLLWPLKGSRIVAHDLIQFLYNNPSYEQILLHGFSVGAYLWGESLTYVVQDRQKYDKVIERIVGHIWDSAADISELTIGASKACFPNNEMLENLMRKYLQYHLKTFYNQATQHYIRSSQMFHSNTVPAPGLFLMSNTDPIGSVRSNMRVRDSWDSQGMTTYVKIFDKSPHVGHFRKYPKEYVAELYSFLDKLRLIQNEEKIRQRL